MAKPLLEHLKANVSLVTVDSGGGRVWLLDFRRQNRSLASNGITHFFLENINRFAVLNFSGEWVPCVGYPDTEERPWISYLRCCRTMFSGSEVWRGDPGSLSVAGQRELSLLVDVVDPPDHLNLDLVAQGLTHWLTHWSVCIMLLNPFDDFSWVPGLFKDMRRTS